MSNHPLDAALARGHERALELLETEGPSLSLHEAQVRLGLGHWTDPALQRLLWVWPPGDVVVPPRYPGWQFTGGEALNGIEEVLARLREAGHDPWAQLRFFLKPSSALYDARPLDLLRRGQLMVVLAAVDLFDTHGAP